MHFARMNLVMLLQMDSLMESRKYSQHMLAQNEACIDMMRYKKLMVIKGNYAIELGSTQVDKE